MVTCVSFLTDIIKILVNAAATLTHGVCVA